MTRLLALVAAAALAPRAAARDALAHEAATASVREVRPGLVLRGGYYSGAFGAVAGVHCDRRSGEILVADSARNAVEIFDERGAPLFTFTDDVNLRSPSRIVVDARGDILVLDDDRTRIQRFSYRGEYLGPVELQGLDPEAPRAFTALAVDEGGDLWVGDTRAGQVVAYGRTLKPKLRLGTPGQGPGQFDGIVGIAVDAKHVYVASQEGLAIHVFTRSGRFLRAWGHHDVGLHNVSLPAGIAVDAKGRVLLLDTLRQEIKYFESDGRLAGVFGGFGPRPGEVAYPTDLSLDRRGRLCVADGGNKRAQVLDPVEAEAPAP